MSIGSRIQNAYRSFRSDHSEPGFGIGDDNQRPKRSERFTASRIDEIYADNAIIRNIVGSVADDSTRAGFEVIVKDDETGIGAAIASRLDELKFTTVQRDLVHHSRKYQEGGYLSIVTLPDGDPKKAETVQLPFAQNIVEIMALNVTTPHKVTSFDLNNRPLSENYGKQTFTIDGAQVHDSRLIRLVRRPNPDTGEGESIVQDVHDAALALDSALESVRKILKRLVLQVFKSEQLHQHTSPDDRQKFLNKMKREMGTMDILALMSTESYETKSGTVGGIKDLTDFAWDRIASDSGLPLSIIKGEPRGIIRAGKNDLLSYFREVESFQVNDLEPAVIRPIIDLVVRETSGKVKGLVDARGGQFEYDITFNPLFTMGPELKSKVELAQAQTDNIYWTNGATDVPEIRKNRHKALGIAEDEAVPDVEPEGMLGQPPPVELPADEPETPEGEEEINE